MSISFINAVPALLVEKERVVVAGDLHIGMESKFADSGVMFPNPARRMAEELLLICKENDSKKVVLLGDVKDSLANMVRTDMLMLKEFFDVMKGIDVNIVKGNHDANLDQILGGMGFNIPIAKELLLDDVALMHGNALPSEEAVMKKYIVCGHGHIAAHLNGVDSKAWLVAPSGEGMKEHYKKYNKGIKFVAAPAFNRLIIGSRVSRETEEHIPLLNNKLFDFAKSDTYDLYGNMLK
ncbi:MAG: metallophosphoesterase family protein [Candidatus Micrarchaeota archaeon]|nr:metallophosphoesterase family protein [Candidatus Micrarchaeota archaeon]MDE1834035.1 metallophosphoesterase family protein [Candidatus Micrarchaeota archaeon]MDE1859125.1 metallophosphoesterase family protein [Candidatus Micrarchaeota archaeon]